MKFVCIISLTILSFSCFGQNTDYNKIIIPERVVSVPFDEKLIQLAWKNDPTNRVVEKNMMAAKQEKNIAKFAWLDDVSAQGNLNEFTLHPDNSPVIGGIPRSVYYPRYNLGIRVSLGTFALTPMRTKAAEYRASAANDLINSQKILVRKNVLLGIELLKEQYKVLKFRSRMKEDFLALYKTSEQKFAAGQVPLDEYRLAAREYVANAELEVLAQSAFQQRKIELESLIGLTLQEVSGYDEFLQDVESQIKFE